MRQHVRYRTRNRVRGLTDAAAGVIASNDIIAMIAT